MSYFGDSDFLLEVAKGNVAGHTAVNKFGHAVDGVQTTITDIWDRADATPTQQIWLAPTAARIHAITSTSTNDDGDPAGTGARTLRIYGLQTWSSAETSEDITMDGTSNVNTVNSYVIIHRMKVLTSGASGPNVGIITATAATDSTVTAAILASAGQTQMAIYGVPSTQTFYVMNYRASIIDSGGTPGTARDVGISLVVNEFPNTQPTVFITKDNDGIANTSSASAIHEYAPPSAFAGPCIIKVQGIGSAADTNVTAGFDGILVTN